MKNISLSNTEIYLYVFLVLFVFYFIYGFLFNKKQNMNRPLMKIVNITIFTMSAVCFLTVIFYILLKNINIMIIASQILVGFAGLGVVFGLCAIFVGEHEGKNELVFVFSGILCFCGTIPAYFILG